MKMNSQSHSTAVMALLIMVAAILACSVGDETQKANKLVDEGNAAVQEAGKHVTEAEQKKSKMLNMQVAELEQARTVAKEAIADYEQAKQKCAEASSKYEEASKLKINDKYKEYLALKAKEYKLRSELVETAKATPQALIDSENQASFTSKAKANNQKVDKLSKEADDLGAQADKIRNENKGVFKS
jgi:hypothetical protein